MSRKKSATSHLSVNPALPLQHLFGPPLLLEGEDLDAYLEFLRLVREHVKPKDIWEEIWISDAVDHTWQIPRLRNLQVQLQEQLLQVDSHPFPVSHFEKVSANLQRVEHLIGLAERRRNAALREIGFYRTVFAGHLRDALEVSCQAIHEPSRVCQNDDEGSQAA